MDWTEYIVVMWPESQNIEELEGFEEHAYLINDEKGLEDFGEAAYFVEKEWLQKIISDGFAKV